MRESTKRYETRQRIELLESKIAGLRDVLEFYSIPFNYAAPDRKIESIVQRDRGKLARIALALPKGPQYNWRSGQEEQAIICAISALKKLNE